MRGQPLSAQMDFGKAPPLTPWLRIAFSFFLSCRRPGGGGGGAARTRGPGQGPGGCHCGAEAPSRDRTEEAAGRGPECGCGGGKWGCPRQGAGTRCRGSVSRCRDVRGSGEKLWGGMPPSSPLLPSDPCVGHGPCASGNELSTLQCGVGGGHHPVLAMSPSGDPSPSLTTVGVKSVSPTLGVCVGRA